ncbi:putative late blight resistance protein homolog R1B-16 [Henckelia pumila]|uniref:putative late blight resistance protein homolog R1B-16 n=1 Tax=Henckelia pumila TaxID=405737 RepID=UPI003C6E767B
MAAYASLLSLGHILDHLLQHLIPRQMAVLDKAQIDSLLENITFLQKFLEDFSLMRRDEIQGLEEKIVSSANAAKDVIESFVAVQILQNSKAKRRWVGIFRCLDFVKLLGKKGTLSNELRSFILFSQDLQKVIEEISSMKKDVMKIKETEGIKIMEQPSKAATAGSFIRGASNSKNTMVGFDEDLTQIKEKLAGHQSNLRIISIVGMGGIGKTTLATNVYHDPFIEQTFHIRAWATISQQYSVRDILLALLKDIRVPAECSKDINQLTDEEIGEHLYKSLCGRKYLIVMDDVWSTECWDEIKRFFPANNNGSRVMVTTRLTNVADDFRSCVPHQLRLLDEDQSWALFCDKVFGPESCPPEFEKVGKIIVRNCGALPLAIVDISGLLAKSSRTVEYWEYVANDTYEALNMGGDGLCFEILYLSYKHLPVHLEPCFLYMATFLEDSKMRISKLVKLWVGEGILKPIRSRSLEEIAVDNLKDLIDRNLIMIHDYGSRNKMKSCIIHDLLRDLSLREALKEKFLGVNTEHSLKKCSRIIDNKHRIITQLSTEENKLLLAIVKLNILRKVVKMGYFCSDEEIVPLLNVRYIFLTRKMFKNLLNTLGSASMLWNLQAIDISGWEPTDLPAEIWEMLKMEIGDFHLPDPPSTNIKNGRGDIIVLKNLQTLRNIRNFRFTDEVVHRLPNLKKLGISYMEFPGGFGWDHYEVYNLARLRNLESLFLKSSEKNVLQNVCFPSLLKKLTLMSCEVCWEDLTVVGSLPHLEVLNLLYHAVKGREWKPVEGQFLELKSLRIEHSDVEEWIADSSHFPSLEKLKLVRLRDLKEIPDGIGEIPTLGLISLVVCSESANSSARKIKEDQQNLGNSDLQVNIVDDAMV